MKNSGEVKILMILALVVALGIGGTMGLKWVEKRQNDPNAPENRPKPPELKWDAAKFDEAIKQARHVEGPANATVSIIEFADFQCPSCRRAYNDVLSPLMKSTKSVRIGFMHFPLVDIHQFAMPAALASEAAAKQGKFWPMYQQLFEGVKTELSEQYFEECAKKAGLDLLQFKKDRADPALKALIEQDQKYGETLKVGSTPTFIIRDAAGKVTTLVGGKDLDGALKKMNL